MNKIQKIFKNVEKTPIWFMRQAGRYLPEYRNVRQTEHNFLEFCYNPEKAAEVTLQPIKRFGFNAAIIFSDILVLPHALGWNIKFEENVGPILQQFKSSEDFNFLKSTETEKLNKVYDAINIVKSNLPTDLPLIGFAGSPWTVVSYMLEGKGKQDFSISKKFIYENNQTALDLINFITEKTIKHLSGQIEAGCNIIQLFDSWAGMLSGNEYLEFVIKPTNQIVQAIKDAYPNVPIIGFPKGSGYLYEDYINNTGIDIIGVDQFVPVQIMRKWQEKIIVQGNLDPVILLTNKDIIEKKLYEILSNMDDNNFIFNLGHGILPATPVKNVEFVVNYVQNFRR